MNYNHELLTHFLIIDDSVSTKKIRLVNSVYFIGRHSDSSIKLNFPEISRHHATLIRKDLPNGQFSYFIIDGNLQGKKSQNGIIVNGKKVLHHELRHGDLIVLGMESIRLTYQVEHLNTYTQDSNGEIIDVEVSEVEDDLNTKQALENTLVISEQNFRANFAEIESENLEILASFAELSPYPIVEFNLKNQITYSNSSCEFYFKNLGTNLDLEHPFINGLSCSVDPLNRKINVREIHIQDRHFEQYVHYLTTINRVRCYFFDITERKQSAEKLQYHLFHDYLTGINNRESFYWSLAESLREATTQKQKLAIIFLDIDRFKNVNDSLNHTTGDKLLESFVDRISSNLPQQYFFARWGSDEFTIIITPLKNNQDIKQEIQEAIKTITDCLQQPFTIEHHTIYITCSFGTAIYPENGKNEETLVRNADIALAKAKQKGKNNHQFYDTLFSLESEELFKLEAKLYNARDNHELMPYYQPQLDLKNRKIVGFETLLRWDNPELGMISPAKFIPIAEETGLIISIGEWVLQKACQQTKEWQDCGYNEMTVAVNVSAKQFQQPNFVHIVKQILDSTGLAPQYLELEITESLFMDDIEKTEQIMKELTDLKVKFSLDDFGTGYSSLSYLKRLPFNTVKIDKSFIDDLEINPQDQALIKAIITLGQGHELKVVAEGVESKSQVELLKELGCDCLQGYWLSPPVDGERYKQFLDSGWEKKSIS